MPAGAIPRFLVWVSIEEIGTFLFFKEKMHPFSRGNLTLPVAGHTIVVLLKKNTGELSHGS
jgi:hypothetical protein